MFSNKLRPRLLLAAALVTAPHCFAQEEIKIDPTAKATPFPHFWEQMFGSGRAILTLARELP